MTMMNQMSNLGGNQFAAGSKQPSKSSSAPSTRFGQANMPQPTPEMVQQFNQQLANLGLTIADVEAEVQKTGNPLLAFQNLGLKIPQVNTLA